VGQPRYESVEKALEVDPLGGREVLEQRRHCFGSSLEDASRGGGAFAREPQRVGACVPAWAPLHEPGLHQSIDEPPRAGLRQPDDAFEVTDGSPGVGTEVHECCRAASFLRDRGLRGVAHTVDDGQRMRSHQLLEPATDRVDLCR
jgi:hypothetical protein